MSSVPLGLNLMPIKRALTTTSTAIFVPFTTQELFMAGESLYYGLNALSNNMIMVDRKKLKNPNGLILGTPGSGKSFSAKREITNAFLSRRMTLLSEIRKENTIPLSTHLEGRLSISRLPVTITSIQWTSTWIILMMITRWALRVISFCPCVS